MFMSDFRASQEISINANPETVLGMEVDLGDAAEQFGGVEAFKAGRGAAVHGGMQKTLENVKQAAEK